jgi:ribosomal protein S18 acetylase RimI-like enzyme
VIDCISAQHYSYEALAALYNQTRVDYLVPMPMNARRMEEYIRDYDVHLSHSVLAIDEQHTHYGIAMLGLRDHRAWITRLGVLPQARGHRIGELLVRQLLNIAQQHGAVWAQLEVIKGNASAHRLFTRMGFSETRELLVLRRPPSTPPNALAPASCRVTAMHAHEIAGYLRQRPGWQAWTEEAVSLLNGSELEGFTLQRQDGRSGWLILQRNAYQIGHIALNTEHDEEMAQALLYVLHSTYPQLDTKAENLPTESGIWAAFQRMGYVEAFRRTEMIRHF